MEPDLLDENVKKLLGDFKNKGAKPKTGVNDDSFTNLQAAGENGRLEVNDPKVSMIQSAESGESFFQNKSSFVFDHDNL